MILVLDDDALVLDVVDALLCAEGYRVVALQDAELALDMAGKTEPELIISDVMMPGMTGFEFRVAYQEAFPNRATPFAFLSSARDTDHVVQGLDLGVDDYLTKPIIPDIFKAKIRSLLTRARRNRGTVFRGNLSSFAFPKLLSFCERQGLSGDLEVVTGDDKICVRFTAGNLVAHNGDAVDEAVLETLFDASDGAFHLWSRPVDFSSLAGGEPSGSSAPPSSPAGLLSTVTAAGKIFQIQTEYVPAPDNFGVTVVVHAGKTLMKQQTDKLSGVAGPEINKRLEKQHAAVEDAIRAKLERLQGGAETREATLNESFERLFDEGMAHYLERDFAAALGSWEKAQKIEADNELLALNMTMLRKKLSSGA